MGTFLKGIKKPLLISIVLLIICGVGYPLLLTGISQLIFPKQANGSLITVEGKTVGSELIGQDFSEAWFMKSRPSAVNYNTYSKEDIENGNYAGVSSGSKNYAPTNPELVKRVEADLADFLAANPNLSKGDIPTDLLTASGSGLDPHISTRSAEVQIPALVLATGLSQEKLEDIEKNNTQARFLGVFGDETVNVIMVNLEIAREMNLIGNKSE